MINFKDYKDVVKRCSNFLDMDDPTYWWRAEADEKQIKVFWGYIDGWDTDFFSIKESDNTKGFLIAEDAVTGETINGMIVGTEFYEDGPVEACIEKLFKNIYRYANAMY